MPFSNKILKTKQFYFLLECIFFNQYTACIRVEELEKNHKIVSKVNKRDVKPSVPKFPYIIIMDY